MQDATTVTIRLKRDLAEKLNRLARESHRSTSMLGAEALEAYVERELDILAGVEQGLADLQHGRMVEHGDAMDQLDAVVDAAVRRSKAS